MKFFILKENLMSILKTVSCVIERNIDKTNDHCIYFKIFMNVLFVISFNKSLEVVYNHFLNCDTENGDFSVSLRKFNNIIKIVPNNELIEITKLDEELLICIKKLKFRISLASDYYYKKIFIDKDEQEIFSISSFQLQSIYKKIFFSISENDFRVYLNGIFFDIKGDVVHIVTSDGHRLSMYKFNLLNNNIFKQIIIPGKNFEDIVNIFQNYEEIKIFVSDTYVKFFSKNIIVKTNLLIGKYPEYLSILSNSLGSYLIFSRKDMLNLFLRVSILNKKSDCIVKMNIIGKIVHLSTYTNIKEYVEDVLEIFYYNGNDIVIAFNALYVIDILNAISDCFVLMIIKDHKSAIIIEPLSSFNDIKSLNFLEIQQFKKLNNSIYVLMPIRL